MLQLYLMATDGVILRERTVMNQYACSSQAKRQVITKAHNHQTLQTMFLSKENIRLSLKSLGNKILLVTFHERYIAY